MIPLYEMFVSVQGEGFNAGVPALFLRVSGCDVNCKWCDTKKALKVSKDKYVSTKNLRYAIDEMLKHTGVRHIVITGGEPGLYRKELRMVFSNSWGDSLFSRIDGMDIETNGYHLADWNWLGKMARNYGKRVHVCVSPKFSQVAYKPLKKSLDAMLIDCTVTVKIVVESVGTAACNIVRVRDVFKFYDKNRIYLQPLDNNLELARELVANGCFGCRLSLQQHKILGVM